MRSVAEIILQTTAMFLDFFWSWLFLRDTAQLLNHDNICAPRQEDGAAVDNDSPADAEFKVHRSDAQAFELHRVVQVHA